MNKVLEKLVGLTIASVEGMKSGSEEIIIRTECGREFRQFHERDCCESVYIEDVAGDVADLIGKQVVLAEVVESSDAPPPDVQWTPDSHTWSFVKIRTTGGDVTIRWYGESNGYYCETPATYEFVNGKRVWSS